jgi:hypothetical protein
MHRSCPERTADNSLLIHWQGIRMGCFKIGVPTGLQSLAHDPIPGCNLLAHQPYLQDEGSRVSAVLFTK